jgi:hypothetical protein
MHNISALVEERARSKIQSFSLGGRTHAQARKWPGEQVGARGLDAHAWGACARTHGATYGVERSADALVELAAWFNAEFVLVRV